MILDFWYSERCTREIKLMTCISTCVIIFLCAKLTPLSSLFVGLSLAIGVFIHVLRMLSLKINATNPYQTGFQIIFFVLILTAMINLLIQLPKVPHLWALAIQSIGFIALGLFIVSIYTGRSKRFE